ncbi:AbiH family protein [Lactiplantibacillus plantarum]|uniref:AbiH family protein n=1 Tax=Lactiplantibacillus plantarum TaxID=1590 RepID=UPI001AAE1B33|nr:AbiH family protein [Lactiplantibacillus plantarum]MBO2705790.1 hypothetical protein [Lactiplantibacillus plantarum]MDN7038276.1 hypothetical protein [Lactiplantibacillus plantarum]MDO7795366.1 AbiH family protein [Lactiplantibacillus plantarum]WVI00471.1 AbiH family protein [Lactiplantibacillus plantarum]
MTTKTSQKLLVLGNGFDLYQGYPFTYRDFFKYRHKNFLTYNNWESEQQKQNVLRFLKKAISLLDDAEQGIADPSALLESPNFEIHI